MPNSQNIIRELPILVLNVHSRCNCRCVMCDIWKRETSTELRVDDLAPHREAWRRLNVRWVVLSGGEPLLHSDLAALCNLFRQDGIRLTLLTTGLLLPKRASEVASLFDDVIVSLDGPQPVHDSVRRVKGAYQLIVQGVHELRALRAEMRISARTTLQKANFRFLRDTVESAKQIGMDSISFLAADLTSEAFNRPQQWNETRQSEIALTGAEVTELDHEIEQLIAASSSEFASGFIAENPAKLRKIATHFKAHLGLSDESAPMCNAPWNSAVIEADGAVRPCFFHRVIGNIREQSLDNVLNSPQALAFRNALEVEMNSICRRCVCSLNYKEGKKESLLTIATQTTKRGDTQSPAYP